MKKHREGFEVLFYHLDRYGYSSIRSIMNFMQATANMHGRILGTSLDDFLEEDFTWVFSRFHIKMENYPRQYDRISVDTWRSEIRKCFAFREFEVYDDARNLLGAATASAVLMGKSTRKPTDIPGFIKEQFAPDLGRAIRDDFEPIPMFEKPLNSKSFHVRHSDIDLNHHVNNTSYVDWIIESVPEDVLKTCVIKSCEIAYKAEAFYGEKIQSHSSPEAADDKSFINTTSFLHRLVRCGDDKTTTIARTVWEKMTNT
ncbi:MAG: hypothetical protein JEZ12_28790 [Desulfobacterium sp.]|nr:hypothetical protein [Desulfobacterium sp.]